MNIDNNYAMKPQFSSLKISKRTLGIMDSRGELADFNKFLPNLQRKAKKADITVYAATRQNGFVPEVTYGISIRPLSKLKDNAVTKFLGLSKNKKGDAFFPINSNRATEKTFRDLYNSAYYNRNYKSGIVYIAPQK
ncbi:MAG: hypothetical protein K6E29_04955 [Cyanobacteria bacterium RUI128]|nr:hypothetical protein [Cyanobacteria bacterium RUI128]